MQVVALRALALALLWTAACAQDGEDEYDDQDIKEESLSEHQLRRLHSKFDKDGNGKVSLPEVMGFAHQMVMSIAARDIQAILDEIDTSKNGMLELDEHMNDIHNQADGGDEEEQKELVNRKRVEAEKFRAADQNGDQHLDANEVAYLFYPETHDAVLRVVVSQTMRHKDKNGDGGLSPHEFWEADGMVGDDGQLSEEELQDFAKLDVNGDGSVDTDELRQWESGRFHTEEAMKTIFEIAGKDHVSADDLVRVRDAISVSDAQYHFIEWAENTEL